MCENCSLKDTVLCNDCPIDVTVESLEDKHFVPKRAPVLEYRDDVTGLVVCDLCVHEFPCDLCIFGDIV